jgi:hypothetical protein
VQVFNCSRDVVTWGFPASGLILGKEGQTFKKEQAVSCSNSERKELLNEQIGFLSRCISLRRIGAH